MNSITQHAGRRRSSIAVAASVVLALVGGLVLFIAMTASDGPPQPPMEGVRSGSPWPTTTATAVAPNAGHAKPPSATAPPAKSTILTASPPVAIHIPSIGVRTSSFVDLVLAADGSLPVPQDFSAVGWYTAGPSPGQLGPEILAGHVDGHNGPAIFYRLGALRPGAQVEVARKDGSNANFTVDRIQRFAKHQFPTALVYGTTNRAELRLITCGGSFDAKTGHYVDNIVAFAHLVEQGSPSEPARSNVLVPVVPNFSLRRSADERINTLGGPGRVVTFRSGPTQPAQDIASCDR